MERGRRPTGMGQAGLLSPGGAEDLGNARTCSIQGRETIRTHRQPCTSKCTHAHAARHIGSGGDGLQLALGEGVGILEQPAPQGKGIRRAANQWVEDVFETRCCIGGSSAERAYEHMHGNKHGVVGGRRVVRRSGCLPEYQADKDRGTQAVPSVYVAGLPAERLCMWDHVWDAVLLSANIKAVALGERRRQRQFSNGEAGTEHQLVWRHHQSVDGLIYQKMSQAVLQTATSKGFTMASACCRALRGNGWLLSSQRFPIAIGRVREAAPCRPDLLEPSADGVRCVRPRQCVESLATVEWRNCSSNSAIGCCKQGSAAAAAAAARARARRRSCRSGPLHAPHAPATAVATPFCSV